ncbi:hypothetical protein [Pseudarthrobacter cellobiosi]|uniref:hypothetical protein n=1 Tax=Pseudarthrobacter cellobiosi TaxID=2953654 RepID=UPI00208EBAAE|nr:MULTISPECIES: hypothetical protein [unclassified Pseudarthrobacter]MCO4257001.1 hypothetical protein [Pseudarthrobacter sp. HLT1-5]MCO4272988.1 hypothetical protein [Pseudarthrobacter sp. HLT3-5]
MDAESVRIAESGTLTMPDWRNAHPRDPGILEAQRRERASVRSEKGHRWGRHHSARAA